MTTEHFRTFYADAGWLFMRCAELEFTFGSLLGLLRNMPSDEARLSAIANMTARQRARTCLEEAKEAQAPPCILEALEQAVPLYE